MMVWPDFDYWHRRARKKDTQMIGEFLEWMESEGIQRLRYAKYEDVEKDCGAHECIEWDKCQGHYVGDNRTIEQLIAHFCGIDLKAYHNETEATYQMVSQMARDDAA